MINLDELNLIFTPDFEWLTDSVDKEIHPIVYKYPSKDISCVLCDEKDLNIKY